MKNSTQLPVLVLTLSLAFSVCSVAAQNASNMKDSSPVSGQFQNVMTGSDSSGEMGKNIPNTTAGASPAKASRIETFGRDEAKTRLKCRDKKLKKQDRKEVTEVIGNSVDTYLANVYNIRTLQRF